MWRFSDDLRFFENQIHDPRYGIMMKRQEFREKAEEIGFVKYRWSGKTSVTKAAPEKVKPCSRGLLGVAFGFVQLLHGFSANPESNYRI